MNIANDNDIDSNATIYFVPSPLCKSFLPEKKLKGLLFDSESANACVLATSRSSADNYFILSCNSGGQFRNFKTFLEKSEPGNAGQRRLGVWLALKDFT